MAGYPGQYGNVLVRKETLDKSLNTIIGAPVIINHTNVTADNADDLRVGVISNAYYNDKDGWYWCEGVIWDETAQNLITDKKWSVSCSYDFLEQDDEGGTENNIPYDREFTKLNFVHLALVDNPRYERANIVFNSKTVIENGGKGSGNFEHDGRPGEVGGSSSKAVDLTNYFTSNPTMQEVKEFLNKMVEEGKEFATSSPDWFVDIPSSSRKKDHIAKSSQFQRMNKSQKNRHNKYVMALEDLLGSAQYLNSSPNKKPLEKPNTQQYHYFTSEAKIGDKNYKILFDTEEYKGDSTIKPQTVHLYDVREVKNSSLSANVQPSVKNLKEEFNNIITDIQEDFNPIGDNMLNNVENWDPNQKRDEKGRWTKENGVNPNYKEELKQIIDKAKNNPNERQKLVIGKVSDDLATKAKENGLDITEYNHDIDVSGTRHSFKNHSNEKKEELRGQIAITDGDFERIPEIVYAYDDVQFGEVDEKGTPLIKYHKHFDDGTSIYAEEVRTRQKTLTIKSLYKRKNKNADNSRTFTDFNPQRPEYISTIIITDNQKNFNPDFKSNVQNNKENAEMALIDELKKLITKVENGKGEDMDDTKEKVDNEKVDKRDIIRQIMAIAGKHEDNEDVRTIAKLAEKLAYEKSEAGTADNGNDDKEDEKADNKKVKNNETKEDEKKDEELKKNVKEDVQNKCKNSVDNSKGGFFDKINEIYNSAMKPKEENIYVSRADKLKAAEEYFS